VLTLFTTLILLSILLVCFLGVIYPVISELLTGNQVTVGPAWYERILGPLFVLLLLLMGVCPLAFWGGNSLKRLGKGLWWLIGASIIIPLLAWFLGNMDDLYALITLWFVSLGMLVILAEYIRDVRSSQKCNTKQGLSTFWTPLVRKNRRYGAFFVHLGIILMSIGIVGLEGLQQETQVTLDIGESASLSGYQFTFNDLENFNREDGVNVSQASLSVTKDGRAVTNLTPQRHIYFDMGLAITQPSVKSNLVKDIYAILVEFTSGTQNQATFRLYVTPLVNWLWIGVGVLTLGAIVAVLPSSRKKQESHS
jgi:cytochrome c-type biogenesis protein CcmF